MHPVYIYTVLHYEVEMEELTIKGRTDSVFNIYWWIWDETLLQSLIGCFLVLSCWMICELMPHCKAGSPWTLSEIVFDRQISCRLLCANRNKRPEKTVFLCGNFRPTVVCLRLHALTSQCLYYALNVLSITRRTTLFGGVTFRIRVKTFTNILEIHAHYSACLSYNADKTSTQHCHH